jgi:hypothetical protein
MTMGLGRGVSSSILVIEMSDEASVEMLVAVSVEVEGDC